MGQGWGVGDTGEYGERAPTFVVSHKKGKRCAHQDIHCSFIYKSANLETVSKCPVAGKWVTDYSEPHCGMPPERDSSKREQGSAPHHQRGEACCRHPLTHPWSAPYQLLSMCVFTHTFIPSLIRPRLTEDPDLENELYCPASQKLNPTALCRLASAVRGQHRAVAPWQEVWSGKFLQC